MKTLKKSVFSILSAIILSGMISAAAGTEIHETYTWKYNIGKDSKVAFDNYDCNLTIHTWDKGETEYHLTIDAKARSAEDAEVLQKYLRDLKFSNSASSVSFRSNFWENRTSIMGRINIKLEGGKEVSLSEFSIKGELWIPSGCRFELGSKYSEINMEDFSGLLFLDLYNDNFYGSNLEGKAEIRDKYSNVELKNIKDLRADIYNSKLEALNTGNIKIVSKYSKFKAAGTGNMEIDAYNDNYNIPKTGDIIFTAKYSNLNTETSGNMDLNCYEGTVITKLAKDVKITSKYADYQIAVAENISIASSYNDKLAAEKAVSLKIDESKYCSFRINELTKSVTLANGYNDKFTIVKTGTGFSEMNINGKYIEVSLSLLKATSYRFKAKIQYPDLKIDETMFKIRTKIVENSNLEYDAVKGVEKEGMPVIEVRGYQVSLRVTEL